MPFIHMGHIYAKNLFIVYLKFKFEFKWAPWGREMT